MDKGWFIVKDKHENVEWYPLFENEISEGVLKSCNIVMTGTVVSCVFWGFDVIVLTLRGRLVFILKSLADDLYVQTRLCPYAAVISEKWWYLGK